jgi:uracil phosphoribosyltransferase
VPKLTVVDHPLVHEKLARMRDKRTSAPEFRRLMTETGALLAYEALRGARTVKKKVATPLQETLCARLAQPVVFVGILRAGLGLVDGLRQAHPDAATGHIGMYRNEETLSPVRYYVRLPKLEDSLVVLADPMLATGGSAVAGLDILKSEGARRIVFVSLVSSRVGVQRVHKAHPDVPVVTAAVDPKLNEKGYIVPGLGDAGDRLFGT